MITFSGVTKQYPDGTTAVDNLDLEHRRRIVHGVRRAVRLRQDHVDADDQPDDHPDRGNDHGRRPRHRPNRRGEAATRHRLRHPERRTAAAPHGGRQRRDRAGAARRVPTQRPQGRVGGARTRRTRSGAGHPLSRAAVGWAAATRRGRAGVGRRPADPADGRAVQRRRSGGPRRTAGRDAAPAGRDAQDDRVRHPRHRRGSQARRPDGRLRAGRAACSSTTRPRRCCPRRPPISSPRFVGRDRGYRGLSFRTADQVPLHTIRTATENELPGLRLEQGEWVLVVTDAGVPRGWIDVTGVEGAAGGTARLRMHVRRAVRCSPPAPICGRPWTRPSPRRRASAWPSTPTARSSAASSAPRSIAKLAEQRAAEDARGVSNRVASPATPDGP